MADAGAAVVADPVDGSGGGFGEDGGEGLQDGEGDVALVWSCGTAADAIAGDFWDEERGVGFPGCDHL